MASAKRRTSPPKPADPPASKVPTEAPEPLTRVLINMVIGMAVVAVMGLIVIGMIRMLNAKLNIT